MSFCRALGALGLATTVLLGGCGGPTRLSVGQLRSAATQVCQTAGARTDRIPAPAAPAASDAYLKRGVAILTPELRQLKRLRPPTDVADVYGTAVGAFAQKLGALGETVTLLDHGADPVAGMQQLQRRLAPLESTENGAWQALQIPACINR